MSPFKMYVINVLVIHAAILRIATLRQGWITKWAKWVTAPGTRPRGYPKAPSLVIWLIENVLGSAVSAKRSPALFPDLEALSCIGAHSVYNIYF